MNIDNLDSSPSILDYISLRPNYQMYSSQNLSLLSATNGLKQSCYAYPNASDSTSSVECNSINSLMYSNLLHIHNKSAHYANMVLGLKGMWFC